MIENQNHVLHFRKLKYTCKERKQILGKKYKCNDKKKELNIHLISILLQRINLYLLSAQLGV